MTNLLLADGTANVVMIVKALDADNNSGYEGATSKLTLTFYKVSPKSKVLHLLQERYVPQAQLRQILLHMLIHLYYCSSLDAGVIHIFVFDTSRE